MMKKAVKRKTKASPVSRQNLAMISIVVLVFIFLSVRTAAAYYSSGATLNPSCRPYDSNCDVYPIVTVSSSIRGLLFSTSTGILSLSSDYTLPVTSTAENWNFAYNTIHKSYNDWQDAADTVIASSSNWQTATDAVLTNLDRWQGATQEVEDNSATWNSAYSWGNHASAGYLHSVFGNANATGSIVIGGIDSAQYPLEILSTVTVSGTNYGYLDSEGNVSVGASTGDVPVSLRTVGRAFIGDEIDILSDARLKDFIDNISPDIALSAVSGLTPLHFQWKSGGNVSAGFFAQDVREKIPEAVTVIPSAFFSDQHMLNYNVLTTYALAAIQALDQKMTLLLSGTSTASYGELTVSDNLTVVGTTSFGSDSVGELTLPAGSLSVGQSFNQAYEATPVITLTPESMVAGSYWVENDGNSGFIINVSSVQDSDVKFYWHAFAVGAE